MTILKLILLLVFILVIFLMIKRRKLVQDGQVDVNPLTRKEKISIWILSFLNPVIAGAIFYYGWKEKLPIKAKQANQISLWVFFILILFSIGLFVLIGLNEERISNWTQTTNSPALMDISKFYNGFEGKTYGQAIDYCKTFDSTNKDRCLLSLAIQAVSTEEDTNGIEAKICPNLSNQLIVMCYVTLDKCDSINNETTKAACKAELEKKNEYLKTNNTSSF